MSANKQIVLVTGASRGIGAEVARQLASPDRHVLINYREKAERAQAVAEDITAAGGHASIVQADLSNEQERDAMLTGIQHQHGPLDVLILNASGGLERGADPGYPMRINRDAQVHLTQSALPLMRQGGRIVFVTSHQAHFHGRKPVPAEYIPIAESKRAGEDALRAMEPAFARTRAGFVVVSGDMIDGTIIVRLLERRNPDAVTARRSHGDLPSIEQFASAIVAATHEPHASGDTIYVGGQDYLTASHTASCCDDQ
ncbi:3-oxoacyl-[acyl-carrier-protein] reductase FabG [Mycobacteroides salmoniphilum]|uniref:3-oxoacyl-[acyl-carrier-protein] reductase MabA n=1 Tax=Mycobacteroides salmoniphilum TaxID=404941 RepID=A0A4R8SWI1_9MYCO|nr:3-oxoacyl-[acyl-carrier-protein] reductase FabG [Mycobacteroides salmoniphilum]